MILRIFLTSSAFVIFSIYGYAQGTIDTVLTCEDVPLGGIDSIIVTKASYSEHYTVSQNYVHGTTYSNEISSASFAAGIIEIAESWNGYTLKLEHRKNSTWVLHYEDECQNNSQEIVCIQKLNKQ